LEACQNLTRIRMPRRIAASCPPGVWCLTPTLGICIIAIAIAIAGYLFLQSPIITSNMILPERKQQKQQKQQPIHIHNNIQGGGGDDRYTRAPEPLQFWQTPPDLRGALIPPGGIAINVSTRGLPQSFQQVGILKSDDKLLPLYGRQTAYRSDRYNYYTRNDTYNPVQLPVRFERRDCMDSIGCSQLFGGEKVKIKGLDKDGHVEIYKFDGPSYIPGIV
jgi:hypothetical protein